MLRLHIVPECSIHPKEERLARDMHRRRLLVVRHRTSHILSLQSMISRNCGTGMLVRAIKRLDQDTDGIFFTKLHLVLAARSNIAAIRFLKERSKLIKKEIKPYTKLVKK